MNKLGHGMNAMYAKFGLQGMSFATLPNAKQYQLFKQKETGIITLDIQNELAILANKPDYKLHISVPTLGFTDPVLDYSAVPRFPFPISINGFVANESHSNSAKAIAYGIDLAHISYPLLRNQHNIIDYTLIEAQHTEVALFTTLRAITYVFQSEQMVRGLGLSKMTSPEMAGMMEFWLCYPAKTPVTFEVTIKDDYGVDIQNRKICYYPTQQGLLKARFAQDETINCEASVSDPFHYYRTRWTCDVHLTNTTLRLTHHAGLSYLFMRALLEHLIPQAHFFAVFSQKNSKQVLTNRYDRYPEHQAVFYNHMIESIINQSLPLLALQDFFRPDAHDENLLRKISERFDDHDMAVFKQSQRPSSLASFVDGLDELISLRDPLFAAQLQVPLNEHDTIKNVQLSFTLEDKEGSLSVIPGVQRTEIQEPMSIYVHTINDNHNRGLRRK